MMIRKNKKEKEKEGEIKKVRGFFFKMAIMMTMKMIVIFMI